MERIKALNRYQKGILIVLMALALVFGVIYCIVSSRVGIDYHDVILELHEDNGNSVYAGTVTNQPCSFTVTADKTVTFRYGEKAYGPYTAKEDPTAIPKGKDYLTGVQILDGDTVFFRGGVYRSGEDLMLFDEDGNMVFDVTVITSGNGISTDENGNIIDPMAPSATTILELMSGPELVSKGNWFAYVGCILLSIFIAVSILFAEEMFQFSMLFRVRNVSQIEPSDWEICGRYIGWTALTIMAFAIYIIGLR